MNTKAVLFIDDGDINNIIEKLSLRLRGKGYDLKPAIINLGQSCYKTEGADHSLALDFDKIQSELMDNHMDVRYDLVACDFNFANDPINGFKVIQWLKSQAMHHRKRIRRAMFISYSAEVDKAQNTIHKNNDLFNLIKIKIDGFYDRDNNLADSIAKLLLKNKDVLNLSDYMIDELEAYHDMNFQSIYPKFLGKNLGEIAHEIDIDSHHGREFQKYLVELTIAHIIELNKSQT